MVDLYFWRQFFILFSGLFHSMNIGFMITFPAVLNPAILSPNSTDIRVTSSQASWIAASNGLFGVIGLFIIPRILQTYGRKAYHISCNFLFVIGWIVFSLANNITTLFVARTIHGLFVGGVYIESIIICEYVHFKRRGYFVTIKKIFIAFGALLCHAMSLCWNWRQISTFVITVPAIAVVLTFFWPESPYYLAMKGRFEDCQKSFVWLHGDSSKEELEQLLNLQKKKDATEKPARRINFKRYFQRDFVKPFIIVNILTLLLDLVGRYYFMAYVIQIMVELMRDKSVAVYCSVVIDCLNIFALSISCFVIRRFNIRTMLLSFSSVSVALMLLISLLICLKKYDIGTSLVWLSPALILMQNFSVNVGVVPVSFTLVGEVIPLDLKGVGSWATGIVFTLLYALFMKVTPMLMQNAGLDGTFFIYGVGAALCVVLLHFVVPETKNKTLLQIEDEIKGGKKLREVRKEEVLEGHALL